MKRLLESKLLRWKEDPGHKPLILRGARQTGKTYSVRQFGQDFFRNLVLLDFERNPEYRKIFVKDRNPARILSELSVLLNISIIPGETLLFLDEIQECPEALLTLRYFYEEMPALHVIATGSLLEFAFTDLSLPVGRVQFLTNYPMGFVEFLWATGKEQWADLLLSPGSEIPSVIHNALLEELRTYFIVGGMPECVKVYSEKRSLIAVMSVQSDLLQALRMDFSKYQPMVNRELLNSVLTNLAKNPCRHVKYTKLAEGFTQPTIKKAYTALRLAGLVQHIPSVNPMGWPLIESSKIFKTCLVDVGLMNYMNGISNAPLVMEDDLMGIYEGSLAEQFVAQEFVLALEGKVYYWERDAKSSSAEVDFVFPNKGSIYPIEVKSSKAGKLKSLHFFLQNYPHSGPGVILSTREASALPEQNLVFLPLYKAFGLACKGLNNIP